MEFSFHLPPAALADWVKAIWCARGSQQEFDAPDPIVPDGCVEMVFNLGDPFVDADTGELQPRDLIVGQMTRPVTALPTGSVDLIGVRLKTSRGGAALRVPMSELQDRLIAGADLGCGWNRVADDLQRVAAIDRIPHLVRRLRSSFGAVNADSLSAIEHALAIIDSSSGAIPIERMARMVGISRRHLERQFRDHVGLGAKHLARITRVHAALDLLRQQPLMSGAEIAAACGYSDQAHLIRECQRLTGRTPLHLKTTNRSLAAHINGRASTL